MNRQLYLELMRVSYCTARHLLCVSPTRTFQGYRADLPEKSQANPSSSHREEVCKDLRDKGLGLRWVSPLRHSSLSHSYGLQIAIWVSDRPTKASLDV